MATQAERIDALEKENGELKASIAALVERFSGALEFNYHGEAKEGLAELMGLVAPSSSLDDLTERVAKLEVDAMPANAEMAAAELVEGYDPRADLIKAFRQIEVIANHINVRLPG